MRAHLFPSLVVLLAGLAACSLEGSPIVGRLPSNRCNTNAECPDGMCDSAHHLCVAAARTVVLFTATPPSGMASAAAFPTVTAPTSITSGDTVDIQLRPPRTLYGTVSVPAVSDPTHPGQPGDSVRIPASIQFIPTGVSDVVSPIEAAASTTLSPGFNNDSQGYTYSLLLPPATYDVIVRPAASLSDRIPPRIEHDFEVRADDALQRFDLTWPSEYSRWEGVIVDRTGRPIPGLSVRAVDPAHDDLTVSSVGTTTRDGGTEGTAPGSFGINLSPGAPDTWTLRITSTPVDQAWLTIDIPRSVLDRSGYASRAMRIELPSEVSSVLLGAAASPPDARACTGCVAVSATVEGRSSSGTTRPLRNASVTLHTDLPLSVFSTDVRAWYQARAQTAADGTFTAALIPGAYNVFISPTGTDLGSFVQRDFRVRADLPRQMGQIFSLSPRLPTDGRVLTPLGMAVRNARVTALPFADAYVHHPCLDDPDVRDLASRARTAEFTTLDDGSFRLDLDPGLYRVVVEPGERSGYPATLSSVLCVSAAVHNFDITLDTPVEVHGTIRDAANRRLAAATVESNLRIAETGARGVVVSVAHTTANAQGAYTLLLPSSATR